jgi:hypothetical protein
MGLRPEPLTDVLATQILCGSALSSGGRRALVPPRALGTALSR